VLYDVFVCVCCFGKRVVFAYITGFIISPADVIDASDAMPVCLDLLTFHE